MKTTCHIAVPVMVFAFVLALAAGAPAGAQVAGATRLGTTVTEASRWSRASVRLSDDLSLV